MSLQASLLPGAADVTGPENSVPPRPKESGILAVESQPTDAAGKVKVGSHCLCLVQHVVISSLPYRELGSSNTTVSLRQTFVTLEVRLISYWRLLILLLIGKV
jgi:hypothetical protein